MKTKKLFLKTLPLLFLLPLLLAACGKKSEYRNDATLKELKDTVVETTGEENYWPNMELDEEQFTSRYQVEKNLYEDFYAALPMTSVNVDTLVLVKAKDGKAEDIKKALEEYQKKLLADTMQYPVNLAKIQAGKIDVFGNYIVFVQLGGDTTEYEEQEEDASYEHCRQVNEEVINKLKSVLKNK